jgi:hypothetical protein
LQGEGARVVVIECAAVRGARQAQLDKYAPSDPYKVACRAAAAGYNDALVVQTSDGSALDAAIGGLASSGCKARGCSQPRERPR